MAFCPRGKKMTKSLSWLRFFAQGEKEPLYSIKSGSKVAHYIQVVQKIINFGQRKSENYQNNFVTTKNFH
jgi:3-phosphoglycerate kinase